MSLERIKTFEELSPNTTSIFDVSKGIHILKAPCQGPFCGLYPNSGSLVALGPWGSVMNSGRNDNFRGVTRLNYTDLTRLSYRELT